MLERLVPVHEELLEYRMDIRPLFGRLAGLVEASNWSELIGMVCINKHQFVLETR